MEEERLVKCLAQLGNLTRLRIFRLLVKAGQDGLSVGEIQEALKIPGSTLSHHISKLTNLELVKQKREGRILHCIANYELLDIVIAELQNQCCVYETMK
ncbi:ArsR/SmtB family transcription factor [Sulfurospirillum sp. 1612]|uniref:ArsR/SmtB family transcription factor n=1 Tax=Sulfurospirillum sp. 1612 TaxID=3094835 RepID=UPI002F940990